MEPSVTDLSAPIEQMTLNKGEMSVLQEMARDGTLARRGVIAIRIGKEEKEYTWEADQSSCSLARRRVNKIAVKQLHEASAHYEWGVGRAKTAVARVRVSEGAGYFIVNGIDAIDYFRNSDNRLLITTPLKVSNILGAVNVWARVKGGGYSGQSKAIVLALARALAKFEPVAEPILRANSLFTRDSRIKERKKYGRRGARKGFQFSKR